MFTKKILLVSSSKDETITHWVASEAKYLPVSVEILLLKDFLTYYDIQDTLDCQSADIAWYRSDKLAFTNQSHSLLNRILYIDASLFHSFKEEDKEYARREFEAYLGFALCSFDNTGGRTLNGICEPFISLPHQWRLVKDSLSIKTPEYCWGYLPISLLKSKEHYIHSSIFDYLNWSNQQKTLSIKTSSTAFRFQKPKGKPVFVLCLGKQTLICGQEHFSSSFRKDLIQVAKHIQALFQYFICELLFFVEENLITFGTVNIDIIRAKQDPQFLTFMETHFFKEYLACLNRPPLSRQITVPQ